MCPRRQRVTDCIDERIVAGQRGLRRGETSLTITARCVGAVTRGACATSNYTASPRRRAWVVADAQTATFPPGATERAGRAPNLEPHWQSLRQSPRDALSHARPARES
jgi:hypothetical protein